MKFAVLINVFTILLCWSEFVDADDDWHSKAKSMEETMEDWNKFVGAVDDWHSKAKPTEDSMEDWNENWNNILSEETAGYRPQQSGGSGSYNGYHSNRGYVYDGHGYNGYNGYRRYSGYGANSGDSSNSYGTNTGQDYFYNPHFSSRPITPFCPFGQIHSYGSCVSCPYGQIYSYRRCIPIEPPPIAFPRTTTSTTPRPIARDSFHKHHLPERACPFGQTYSNGRCVSIDSHQGTTTTSRPVLNHHLPPSCPYGQIYSYGRCVPIESPPIAFPRTSTSTTPRPIGTDSFHKHHFPEKPSCPFGQTHSNGRCVSIDSHQRITTTTPRPVLNHHLPPSCPFGQTHFNGTCVPIKPVTTATSTTPRTTTGHQPTIETSCEIGSVYNDGKCVSLKGILEDDYDIVNDI